MKNYITIDPGKNGALVLRMGNEITTRLIPKVKDKVCIRSLYEVFLELLEKCGEDIPKIIMEEVHSVFGTSAKSNFEFGRIVGILEAISLSLGVPYIEVQPKEWQKEIWDNRDLIYKSGTKPTKTGKPSKKIDTKPTSLMAFIRLFPDKKNCAYFKTPTGQISKDKSGNPKLHDGIIDAILISEFCIRKNL